MSCVFGGCVEAARWQVLFEKAVDAGTGTGKRLFAGRDDVCSLHLEWSVERCIGGGTKVEVRRSEVTR